MANNHYYITKGTYDAVINISNYNYGYDITPKNSINYDGITVNKLVIIKKSFIEKILKKKIKRKLELYLQFIIDFIDGDEDDSETLREVLNDITRYKEILRYKYLKHLGEEYIDLLLRKIELLEYELRVKLFTIEEKQITYDEEVKGHRNR